MEKNKGGRPDDYTEEIADAVCARLSAGESMRSVCRDESLPSAVTLYAWMRKYPEFLKRYGQAKQESADAFAEDIVDIADEAPLIVVVDIGGNIQFDDKGQPLMAATTVSVAHARLRVDARKWTAAKLKPEKYGEKPEAQTGDDAEALSITIESKPAIGEVKITRGS